MPEETTTSDFEQERPTAPRVAILASRRMVEEYPLYIKFLLLGLADESVPVMLICPPELNIDSIIAPAVEIVRYPAIKIPLIGQLNRNYLIDRLAEFRPSLIHCLCEKNAWLARWLSRKLNINYLLNINSLIPRFCVLSLSSARLTAVISPAKTIADNFAANHHRFAGRVIQINMGTFIEETTACFGHPERMPGIIVAEPIDNPADMENLLQAFRRLTIDGYQFMVVFITARHTDKNIFKKLRSLGLLRIVTVVPHLPEFRSAFTSADIFIVPQPSFCFNSLLLSAMSSGSLVAACKGGVDDLIIDGKTAMVFESDNQLSVYNCLKRAFDAREVARQIASGAQQYLRQSHHVSDMIGSTLALYRKAIEPQKPQPQTETAAI